MGFEPQISKIWDMDSEDYRNQTSHSWEMDPLGIRKQMQNESAFGACVGLVPVLSGHPYYLQAVLI